MSVTNKTISVIGSKQPYIAVTAGIILAVARDEKGATAIEYALIAALAAIGIAGGIGALAELVALVFELITNATRDAADTIPG